MSSEKLTITLHARREARMTRYHIYSKRTPPGADFGVWQAESAEAAVAQLTGADVPDMSPWVIVDEDDPARWDVLAEAFPRS